MMVRPEPDPLLYLAAVQQRLSDPVACARCHGCTHTLDERIKMALTSYLQAAIASVIIARAYVSRAAIGRSASNLAGAAGIVMLANSVLLGAANGFVDEMARDWTELGQTVPVAWGFAQSALPVFSSVLQIVAVGLLALAVFLPRPGTGTRPEASAL